MRKDVDTSKHHSSPLSETPDPLSSMEMGKDMNLYFSGEDERQGENKSLWEKMSDTVSSKIAKVDLDSVQSMGLLSNMESIAKGTWGAVKNIKNKAMNIPEIDNNLEKLQSLAKQGVDGLSSKIDMDKMKGLAENAATHLNIDGLRAASNMGLKSLSDTAQSLLGKKKTNNDIDNINGA